MKFFAGYTWGTTVLMLLLTLLAPCNVRKGIQVSLHVPVTQTTNPAKTTVSHCATYQDAVTATQQQKEAKQQLPTDAFLANSIAIVAAERSQQPTKTQHTFAAPTNGPPLYVRYQKMKILA